MRGLFLLLSLAGCASGSAADHSTLGADAHSYDTVTVTRAAEVLHLLVVTGEGCNKREGTEAEPTTCAVSKPAAHAAVTISAAGDPRPLGTTTAEGRLDVPLAELDKLYADQRIAADARAQLLVHERVAAELPLGEIVNRQSVIDSAITESDKLLEDSSPDRDYAQQLIARLLDLQMRGIADPRIADRASRLYEHLRETESFWAAPRRWLNSAKELLSRLRSSGEEDSVPEHVKADIEQTADGASMQPKSFTWALSVLPTMCKITVRGGAVVAGQLIATGAPGVALAVIAASVGDNLSNWLIQSCCEMASKSLSQVGPAQCGGSTPGAVTPSP